MIKNSQKFTLRFTLGTIVTFLILSVSSLTLAITYYGGMDSIRSLSRVFTKQVSKGIIDKINQLFNSAEESGNITSFAISAGLIDPKNEYKSLQLATFVLSQNPNISSVNIATPDGSKYKASREINGAVLQRSDIRTKKNIIRKYYSEEKELLQRNKDSASSFETGYDARKRPWFKKAIETQASAWTDIYESSSDQQFVYSYAKPIYDQNKQLLAVIAIDVEVTGLSHFLAEMNVFDRGRSFIVNDRRQVIAYPSRSLVDLERREKFIENGEEHSFRLYTTDNFPDQNLHLAMKAHGPGKDGFFVFTGDDNSRWLGSIERYPYRGGMEFLFGVYFPQSSIMAGIYRNALYILAASGLLLLCSILAGNFFARRISSELSDLSKDVDKAGRLDIEEKPPINSRIIEIDSMNRSISRMKVSLKSFKKYVPLELVRLLNSMGQEAFIGGEKQFLTVFFSDIANFTDISEGLPPELLLEHLGKYFDGMSHEILSTGGTLDKYIGDSVMAFWGAPIAQKDHAIRACHAALECKRFTDQFCVQSSEDGNPIFRTRIGLHTGEVVVGNIGNKERMNYTIIGDSVNLASRLESLNKFYDTNILISSSTYDLVKDEFIARKLDFVAVKGRNEGLLIYELISKQSDTNSLVNTFVHQYELGLNHYIKGSWNEALTAFDRARSLSPSGDDLPSSMMQERCRTFLSEPPASDWRGVYKFKEK